MADIDLNAIASEVENQVAGLTDDQVKEQLTALRVKQRVAQKKYQSPERQKAYQMKQKEMRRLLKERAIKGGFYDEVSETAAKLADAKLAEDEVAAEAETE